ncbi:tyrosinase family protein [Streptomyces sp. NPDC050418]|uniref:tyrosinase family protein n=1 Tax=Streptomyces sp. NPDC050418 TaxID=3365612 RepID=UPI003797C27F
MYTRKNQRDLTGGEKRKFVDALLKLKRSGRYDEFVEVHMKYYVADGEEGLRVGHMTPTFFPWHRQFLLDFERALQSVSPGVTVPYWNWTVDTSPTGSLWAKDFLGGTGRDGDRQVMTGPFAYESGDWPVSVSVTRSRFLTRDLGRRGSLPSRRELNWAMDDPVYDVAPWNSLPGEGFRNKVEGWAGGRRGDWRNHNRVHQWVGGLMNGASSPNDPVFWLHHSFMDRLWTQWQRKHPKAHFYLPRRPLRRDDPQYGRVLSADEPMPPFGKRPSELITQNVYRYA